MNELDSASSHGRTIERREPTPASLQQARLCWQRAPFRSVLFGCHSALRDVPRCDDANYPSLSPLFSFLPPLPIPRNTACSLSNTCASIAA